MVKFFFLMSCLFDHTKYIRTIKPGEHIEMSSENDKNLYLLTKLYDGSLFELHMDGFDSRETNDEPSLETLSTNMLKKNILKMLENTELGVYEKMFLISEFDFMFDEEQYNGNIYKGGLLDDWEFEI